MNKKIILIVSDLFVFYFSLLSALFLRYGSELGVNLIMIHLRIFSIILIFWLVVLYSVGFYDLDFFKSRTDFSTKTIKVLIFCFVTSGLFFYFFKLPITPKTNLLIFAGIFSIFFILVRTKLAKVLKLRDPQRSSLFIGSEKQLQNLSNYLHRNPSSGYKLKAYYPNAKSENTISNLLVINKAEKVATLIAENKIKTVISGLNRSADQEIVNDLFKVFSPELEYISLSDFYESQTGKVSIEDIDEFWLLENLAKGQNTLYEASKRLFDIVTSITAGIIFLPFVPLIALLILLTSGGPIFFRQVRIGKNGKKFLAIKFRTMVNDAENTGPQWAKENDPRITGFGSFLRKSHLDEIPQLYNVVWGHMSLVGPRPERPELIAELEKNIPYYSVRHLVQPGITGWAQIMFPYGSSVEDAKEKLQYELFYMKNRSAFLDLKIILKTFYKMLKGSGR